jgi:hypothetical protein
MRGPVFAVAAAIATMLAGCAPTPTPSQPTVISPAPGTPSVSAGVTSSDAPAQHGSLAQCLREHGVPDSAGAGVLGPPAGVDPGVWDQARKACSSLEPGPAN